MAKPSKNEWAAKVLTLVKAGNLQAALAQTKVAPTAGDVERLQALLTALPKTAALLSFKKPSRKNVRCWPHRACTVRHEQACCVCLACRACHLNFSLFRIPCLHRCPAPPP